MAGINRARKLSCTCIPGSLLALGWLMSLPPRAVGLFQTPANELQIKTRSLPEAKSGPAYSAAPMSRVIWSADTETGSTSQWYYPSTRADGKEGGGEFDSGTATTTASTDYAHSGRYSLKRTITTPPESGTRMFRWLEPHTYNDLTYSAWYYLPQRYRVTNYWNIFQWKSKNSSGQVDPFFVLNVGNRGDGSMYLYLYNWQQRQTFTQTVKNIPVGQWFNITARYVCAPDNTGHVTFWQDGAQLFDVPNVQTRYSNGDCQWSTDNYSDGLNPSPAVIYTDDAQILK
jgi:hypothetical protein